MTLSAKELILIPFVIACLPEINESAVPEVSRNDEIGSIARGVVTNSTSNTSTACHFHILESSLKSVLKLMLNSKTNVIKLNVWIESVNDTMTLLNKTRVLTDMQWANEIGRTLYSLIFETRNLQSLIRFLPNVTLTAGVRDVNIVVSEENERCLLSGNNTLDNAIFDFLLRRLYLVSDDDTDYQLCRTDNLTLNCCAIVGDKNIPICSYYSSIVTNFYIVITVATVLFFPYLALPLMLDYLSRFKKESEHYTISDSPMAISSIFHTIFIEGHGPAKSFGRKLLFLIFVLVIRLPVWNVDVTEFSTIFWYIFLGLWTLLFMISDLYSFNDDLFQHAHFVLNDSSLFSKDIFRNSFEIITLPFNLKLWWRKVSKEWPRFYNNLKLDLKRESTEMTERTGLPNRESSEVTERTGLLNRESTEMTERTGLLEVQVQQHGNESQDGVEYSRQNYPETIGCVEIWKYRISIFILILLYVGIAFPFLCVFALLLLSFYFWKFYKRDPSNSSEVLAATGFYSGHLSTSALLMYSSHTFFSCTFLFTIGLFLNGETYNNYFFPLSTILLYSWTNWKSSVETKNLVLITTIYEVCKETTPVQPTALANSGGERDDSANDAETKLHVIKLNDDGEPIIPKKLYNIVREKFLPYDRVLFYYFMGIFFVTVFAFFLYTMISLSERSGVTSSVQVIGSMAATILPIIFDFVWRKNSGEQKAAKITALKLKLKRVLKVYSSNETNGEIKVEFQQLNRPT
ncbi:Hypothetical predicted protein [Paramuricea clavata]|uniref:Uncharacterized protein n=1 Tax=Paramuricea clavata TaxID=317549 RepID=A0A6S7JL27_PARCT|nr:Hypothetical predicted protein [Paramuricea clavata]